MTYEEWEINHRAEIAERNLNPTGWAKMTSAERLENIQNIHDKIAMDMNLIPAEVVTQPLPENELGYQQANTIVINENLLNDSNNLNELTDTLYHESSHLQEFQAEIFPEARVGISSEELAARSSPVPDSDLDWEGYWSHPAEQAARKAGSKGLMKTLENQARIAEVDLARNTGTNQILTTYDYLALEESIEYSTENTAENIQVLPETEDEWDFNSLTAETSEAGAEWNFDVSDGMFVEVSGTDIDCADISSDDD